MTLAGAEADSVDVEGFAFVTLLFSARCWLLDSGGGGTMALCDHSWPFQPLFVWLVTMKTFCPGTGWPNRAV